MAKNEARVALLLAATLLTGAPLLAKAAPPGQEPTSVTSRNGAPPGTTAAKDPSTMPTGGLAKSHGDWRSSRLVGANVYDGQGMDIGTVEDLLVGPDGRVAAMVVSVGGFLGVGDKVVEIPFGRVAFEPSEGNPKAGVNGLADNSNSSEDRENYSLVLDGATKESLNRMPAFRY